MTDYEQTLAYLFSQLPMYQRIGKLAYKANLDNTLALDNHFGSPHRKYQTIHVAGTNGKGSTSHALASILQAAGYRIGLYTSPHLKDFRERIRVNGAMISEQEVIAFVAQNNSVFEKVKPSFFEMTVALAFEHFANHKVDIGVIEVGLGGRLDSTNIIKPILSIITNIGLDHTDLLGDSLQAIAKEKAGIIKQKIPVIISQKQDEVANVFQDIAQQMDSPIIFANETIRITALPENKEPFQRFRVESTEGLLFELLHLDLLGNYQSQNIAGVIAAVQQLRKQGLTITDEHVVTGLKSVVTSTGLRGRWEILRHNPLTICDTGHNKDGLLQVTKQLSKHKYKTLHFVIGLVNDKDVSSVLSILPRDAIYYFTQASIPRAMNHLVLSDHAKNFGLTGKPYPTVAEAISSAKEAACNDDLIFIGGSTFVVAEALIARD